MMSNSESQENELLSLQSIFDEKEFFLDGSNPPSGRIVAEVRLPDGFYVTTVNSDQPCSRTTEEEFQISHLPPITLFFKLPDTYPLESCPEFFLSCNWLSHQKLSALRRQLEHLWEVNMDAILFTWMQFLQEEALDFLEISQCLDISELLICDTSDNYKDIDNNWNDCADNTDDTSALVDPCTDKVPSASGGHKAINIPELSDSKKLIKTLKDYNETKIENIFYATIQDCDVCFSRRLGAEFVKFTTCKHYFCKECVRGYFEELIKDGSISLLKCLRGECNTRLDPTTIKSLLNSHLYERYDRLLLSTTLESMPDIAYCPRRECQCACIVDTCDHMASCSSCGFVFCPLCKMTYHGVEACKLKSEQFKECYDEYINGDASVREAIEKRYGRRAIRTFIEDTMSEDWKDSNSKPCPECGVAIEKTEGCNKMTCFKCNAYFCWRCLMLLDRSNPYYHYENPKSKCFNLLFPVDGNSSGEEDYNF